MTMTKKLILILFSAVAALQLTARDYTPENVPNVQLSDYRQFVSNPDGILSQTTVDEINRMCLDLKEKGLAEVVVLMLGSVEDDALDMFAHNVLNTWGVGQSGRDNGLVISVVKRQRDIQFETGYGLEGVLPDAICKRIQMTYMVPYLKDDNWDTGMLEGVKAVYNVLTDNEEELGALTAQSQQENGADTWLFYLILCTPLALFILIGWLIRRQQNRCPVCKTPNGLKLIKQEVVSRTRNSETVVRTYKCKKCGHILTRRNTRNTGGGGIIIGGGPGSFGGGSRGGFGGGGFGGGRSGGGGARSGF